jgi:hypothetical protein
MLICSKHMLAMQALREMTDLYQREISVRLGRSML